MYYKWLNFEIQIVLTVHIVLTVLRRMTQTMNYIAGVKKCSMVTILNVC